ncbi:MAG: polysaccharide deacetylase family protein [Acidobacteria bacterium]|nr:polysaccharide deacetylase family protein [Acidobacteriota bacterium]
MKIPILTYHRLDESGSVLSTPVATFRRQMEDLSTWGYRTLRLEDLVTYWKEPPDRQPRAIITFDDAYVSVKEQAIPVLETLRFTATIFVPTGACSGTACWNGTREQVMSWEDLNELARSGFELGSHGVDHLDLTGLDSEGMEFQLRQSQVEIEKQLSRPCPVLAYPYGRVNPAVREAAGQRYRVAVTTRLDWASPDSDLLCLPRLEMYYLRNLGIWKHFNDGLGAAYVWLRGVGRSLSGR